MKYVVNTRGRAMAKNDAEATRLLEQGFIEITQAQFIASTYYPEFDRGPGYQSTAIKAYKKTEQITVSTRSEFETKIV